MLAPEAVKVAEKPLHIVASEELTVGREFTVTLTVLVLLQPEDVVVPIMV